MIENPDFLRIGQSVGRQIDLAFTEHLHASLLAVNKIVELGDLKSALLRLIMHRHNDPGVDRADQHRGLIGIDREQTSDRDE